MREAQGDCCPICTKPLGRAHVDHDHATGKVRALLCHHCNIGLGHFRDDKVALARAIDYLTEHAPVNRSIS